jgi:hypothetical protein
MDWLSAHIPVEVHWGNKSMMFQLASKQVTLQGVKPNTCSCKALTPTQLQAIQHRQPLAHFVQLCVIEEEDKSQVIHPAAQELFAEFDHVFAEPEGLPPSRVYDHRIPHLPGDPAVNSRL